MLFKKIVIALVLSVVLFAKADYSNMSTEELLALIGYVTSENETKLHLELDKRINQMSDEEKRIYREFKETQENAQK